MNKTRIAFFGNFGTRNLGNECTLQAIVHNVAARLPMADMFVICSDPVETERTHRLPSVPMRATYVPEDRARPAEARRSGGVARLLQRAGRIGSEVRGWFNAYRTVKGISALIVAGTGPLTDQGESILGFPYEIFKWAWIAWLRGAKVRFVAVGAGPIRGALGRVFIGLALKVADYRTFRDEVSRSRLELAGMKTRDDPVVPDLAFSLPESLFRVDPGAASDRPVIGVGVFDYYGLDPDRRDGEALHKAYVEKMADFIARLLRDDYAVRILVGDLSYDLEVRRAILAKLDERGISRRNGRLISEDIHSVASLLSQLSATTLVVSPRYHNLLLGIMLGKPVLSISYDAKNDALLEGVGLGEYRQPIDSLDVDLLRAQLAKLERDAPRIQHRIRERVASYRRAWEREYAFVLAGLAESLASPGSGSGAGPRTARVNMRNEFARHAETHLPSAREGRGPGAGLRPNPAEGRDARSQPDVAAKVCMLTSRSFIRLAYQAAVFEAQDVLCQTADVDLVALEPGPGFAIREAVLRKALWRDFSGRLGLANPGLRPVRLEKMYDAFIAYCPAVRDLLHVNAIRNWRDRCRTSVCILDEIWAVEARRSRHHLRLLREFDHVVVGLEGSVGIVGELIGRACHFLPAAVDALRFCPYPAAPPRVVDVYSFGRRREAVHDALRTLAAGHGLFYLHETFEGGGSVVRDYRQHRDQIAAIAKRSRCIVVAPAKFDRPDERGAQNEVANRYYEASAAGAVMIGEAPDCESFRRLFDWPQAVVGLEPGGSDAAEVVTSLLRQPGLLRKLGSRNAEQALRRHDWVHRWLEVFRIAGLAPTPGMNARVQRLNGLADLAKRDAA